MCVCQALRYFGIALLSVALFTSSVLADYWEWSPNAKHHAAVCEVRVGRFGGSGVYVTFGDRQGILTARHILVAGPARIAHVRFGNGTTASGSFSYDKYNHDVGFIECQVPGVSPLKVASAPPALGSRVEYVTYGGPKGGTRRHFYATFMGSGRTDAYVISGDSGGAVLNARNEVVGIQAFGYNRTGVMGTGGFQILRGAGHAPLRHVLAYLRRVVGTTARSVVCGPAGCNLYPPAIPPVSAPPVAVTPPSVEVEIDYNRLALILATRHGDKLRGPPGKDGQSLRGPAGPAGTVDIAAVVEAVLPRLPPIHVVASDDPSTLLPQTIRLGETLRLPPIRMEIEYPDSGNVKAQSKPLGEPIRLKLVPVGS